MSYFFLASPKIRDFTSSSGFHSNFFSLLIPLLDSWQSIKPRSSSSDRSRAGIGCLQNKKESYWLLDFSIVSETNHKIIVFSAHFHRLHLTAAKTSTHTALLHPVKMAQGTVMREPGLNRERTGSWSWFSLSLSVCSGWTLSGKNN